MEGRERQRFGERECYSKWDAYWNFWGIWWHRHSAELAIGVWLIVDAWAGTWAMLFCRRQLPGYLALEASAQTPGDINRNVTVSLVCTNHGNNFPHVGRHRRHLCSKLSQRGGKWQCCGITTTFLDISQRYSWKHLEGICAWRARRRTADGGRGKYIFIFYC